MRNKALVAVAGAVLLVVAAAAIYGQVRTAAHTTIATDRTSSPPQTQIIQDGIMPPSPDQIALTRANRVYLWALSLTALFGAVGIGASAFIINYSDRVGEAQAVRIRQLERDRDVAKAEAVKADARIAEANAKAQEAVKQTEKARLATEELRKHTVGRQFSEEQIRRLIDLKDSGIIIEVNSVAVDPEATLYAAQFVIGGRMLGLTVGSVTTESGKMFFGTTVSGPDDEYTKILDEAFRIADPSVKKKSRTSIKFKWGAACRRSSFPSLRRGGGCYIIPGNRAGGTGATP